MGICRVSIFWLLWIAIYAAAFKLFLHDLGSYMWRGPVTPWNQKCTNTPSRNYTGLKVIMPAIGKTGGTSLVDAMRMLGLNAWHNPEVCMYIPGINNWDIKPESWAHLVSMCKIEAVTLEPQIDTWWLAYKGNPRAKVVLTWKDYPKWKRKPTERGAYKDDRWSMLINPLKSSMYVLPWLHIWEFLAGGISKVYAEAPTVSGSQSSPTVASLLVWYALGKKSYTFRDTLSRGPFKIKGQEEGYLAHIDEIRRHVDPKRLLIFDIRTDTWEKLGNFLGLPVPPNGTPFPWHRKKDSWTNDDKFDLHRSKCLIVFSIFLLMHFINMLILRTVSERLVRTVCSCFRKS